MPVKSTIIDDHFQRADTASGAGLSAPTVFYPPSTGENYGGYGPDFKIVNNECLPDLANSSDKCFANRPQSEAALSQEIEMVVYVPNTSSNKEFIIWGTETSGGFGLGICFSFFGTNVNIQTVFHNNSRAFGGLNSVGAVSAAPGQAYILKGSFIQGSGKKDITGSVAPQSTGVVINQITGDSSGSGVPALNTGPGTAGFGMVLYNKTVVTNGFDTVDANQKILSFKYSSVTDTNLYVNTTSVASGSSGNGLVLTGVGTSWLTSNPAFTVSGVAGTSITEQHIVSDTEAVLYLTTGSTTGTLTITDPSQSTKNTAEVSVATATGANPSIGFGRALPNQSAGVNKIQFPPAISGQGPYTYTAYRARKATAQIGDAGVVQLPSGSVYKAANGTIEVADTVPDSKVYTYILATTDSYSTPRSGRSKTVPCFTGYQGIPASVRSIIGFGTELKEGQIGDSISSNNFGTTPKTQAYLRAAGITNATIYNYAAPGYHLCDFDPTLPAGTNYNGTVCYGYGVGLAATLQSLGVTFAPVMMGTNDSGVYGKAAYKACGQNIIDDYAAHGIFVLWETSNWLVFGDNPRNDNIIDYDDAIGELVAENPTKCARGSRGNIVAFAGRPDLFSDDLHPSVAGEDVYARINADGTLAYLQSTLPGLAPGTLSAPSTITTTSLQNLAWTNATGGQGTKTAQLQWKLTSANDSAYADLAGQTSSPGAGLTGLTASTTPVSRSFRVRYQDESGDDPVYSNVVTATPTASAPSSTITSVVVSPTSATLYVGGGKKFTATVNGTGDFNAGKTWSKVNSGDPITIDTTADGGCIVIVNAGASNGSYQIRATSVQDNTKSGTATVTVQQIPSGGGEDRPVWESGQITFLISLLESCRRLQASGDEPLAVLVTAKLSDGTPVPPRDFDGEIQVNGLGQTADVWHPATLSGSRFTLNVVGDDADIDVPLTAGHNYQVLFRAKNAAGTVLQSQSVGITVVS